MGFKRQSKIAGYQIATHYGAKPTLKNKQQQAERISQEAKASSKKSSRKAVIRRAFGHAAQAVQKKLGIKRK